MQAFNGTIFGTIAVSFRCGNCEQNVFVFHAIECVSSVISTLVHSGIAQMFRARKIRTLMFFYTNTFPPESQTFPQ